jgi:hypothetical protein
MRLTRDQVEQISQRIIRGLIRDEFIVTENPEAVIDGVAKVFAADLEAEDRLNDEVHELLKAYADQIARGDVNYQELFRKAKAKLARDRKMVV